MVASMGSASDNPLILFNNHFVGHRRAYPYATRLAIAADLGYDGYEFHPIEPGDDASWDAAEDAFRRSGLAHCGMYVVIKGVADHEVAALSGELARVELILDRLGAFSTGAHKPYLNLAIGSNPSGGSGAYEESGSAKAEERHWRRAAELVAEIDRMMVERGLRGNLYNHVWFMADTPQAILRILRESDAKALHPGIATFHAHFHPRVPDVPELLDLPGMETLAYVALLNAWPEPKPFRTVAIDSGQIDIACFLGHLWLRGYRGPLVMQGYDLGGDPYVTAKACIDYVRSIRERFEQKPHLNPAFGYPAKQRFRASFALAD